MLLTNDIEGRLMHGTGWDALVDDGAHVPDNNVDYPGCDGGEPACVIANEYSIGYSNMGGEVRVSERILVACLGVRVYLSLVGD